MELVKKINFIHKFCKGLLFHELHFKQLLIQ